MGSELFAAFTNVQVSGIEPENQTIKIHGWVIGAVSKADHVHVCIDEMADPILEMRADNPRPGVVAYYRDSRDVPLNCGFAGEIPFHYLNRGAIHLEAILSGGPAVRFSTIRLEKTENNDEAAKEEMDKASSCDEAIALTVIPNATVYGQELDAFGLFTPQTGVLLENDELQIHGWVASSLSKIESVLVCAHGAEKPITEMAVDVPRPAIVKHFEGKLDIPLKCGFGGAVSAALLQDGPLQLVARMANGATVQFVEIRVNDDSENKQQAPFTFVLPFREGAPPVRSPAKIILSVWKALFLREAVERLFGKRAAWLWLTLEPIGHIAMLMLLFAFVNAASVNGMISTVWIMVGLIAYKAFQRPYKHGEIGIVSNMQLFAYRQVRPVDTVLVRCFLELFLLFPVTVLVFSAAALLGINVIPENPGTLFVAVMGLWLFAIGASLVTSILVAMVPEARQVLDIAQTPLYFLSGIMFPISEVPHPYREWILTNPIVHGIELARYGVASHYHMAAGVNIYYLYEMAAALILAGLALQIRYKTQVIKQ